MPTADQPAAPGRPPLGTVVVTGGASGLGAAVAHAVAAAGGTPVVLDVNPPRLEVDHTVVDLADTAAAEEAVRAAAERHGRLHGVVTAAGGRRLRDAWRTWSASAGSGWWPSTCWARPPWCGPPSPTWRPRRAASSPSPPPSGCGRCPTPAPTAPASSPWSASPGPWPWSWPAAWGVTLLVPGGMSTAFFDDRTEQYRPGPDAQLNDPAHVAAAVVFALGQPAGCEVRELVITPSTEPSWP